MGEKKENRVSLPSYAWSPWKEGRSKEEQRELQEIQEIRIPDGVRELGNYTFYGCRNLVTLEMTDSVKTIGGGSFTGCGALRKLHVLMESGGTSCIRDVVSETFHEVYVSIRFRDSREGAELIFPEYYEEGVENTPARILETHYHGCGYKYRQCFLEKKVDYQGYDRMFYLAKINEKPEILLPMAMGRLLWPWELGNGIGQRYFVLDILEFDLTRGTFRHRKTITCTISGHLVREACDDGASKSPFEDGISFPTLKRICGTFICRRDILEIM